MYTTECMCTVLEELLSQIQAAQWNESFPFFISRLYDSSTSCEHPGHTNALIRDERQTRNQTDPTNEYHFTLLGSHCLNTELYFC